MNLMIMKNEISDIAIATKKRQILCLPNFWEIFYANLENHVKAYKPISNHHLDRWLDEGNILM